MGMLITIKSRLCSKCGSTRNSVVIVVKAPYLAVAGRRAFSASSVRVRAMPVATGSTVTAPTSSIPAMSSASRTKMLHSFARSEDPAA